MRYPSGWPLAAQEATLRGGPWMAGACGQGDRTLRRPANRNSAALALVLHLFGCSDMFRIFDLTHIPLQLERSIHQDEIVRTILRAQSS